MQLLSLIVLRILWSVFLFSWIWHAATGKLINPLHPFNLLLMACGLAAATTVWIPRPAFRMTAGVCGVLAMGLMLFQLWALISMFAQFDRAPNFEATIGPFVFQGTAALFVLLGIPVMLLLASITLLVSEFLAPAGDKGSG